MASDDRREHFEHIGTGQLTNEETDRPLWSTEQRTINVPGDVSVDNVWREIPWIIRHKLTIQFDTGSYGDLYIPPCWMNNTPHNGSERVGLQFRGDVNSPTDYKVNSIYADNVLGFRVNLSGLAIQDINPYDNEEMGISARGCTEIGVSNCVFEGGINGVCAYRSTIYVRNVDFGDGVLSGSAMKPKHHGIIHEQPIVSTPSSGHVGGQAYRPAGGFIFFRGDDSTLTSDGAFVGSSDDLTGLAYDSQNETLYNTGGSGSYIWQSGSLGQSVPGEWTTIEFDEVRHSDGEADTANNQLVAQASGRYHIEGQWRIGGASADCRPRARLVRNGGGALATSDESVNASDYATIKVSTYTGLNAGDTVGLRSWHNGGSSESVDGDIDGAQTYLWMVSV